MLGNIIKFAIAVLLLPTVAISSMSTQEADPKCGPGSLLAICELLGVKADLDELCKLSNWDKRTGTTMYDLYQAAHKKGLYAVAVKVTLEELRKIGSPAIAHINGNHFLVIAGFAGDKLCLMDPPQAPYLMSQDDFSRIWKGHALLISKEEKDLPFRDKQNSVSDAEAPDIAFEETLYDFGRIGRDQQVLHTFRFRNTGREPLLLAEVRSSCSCTAALLSEKNIPPGEEGHIEVAFNVSHRRGRTLEEVLVYSNDPDEPVVSLTVTGIVEGGVVVLPERLYVGGLHNTESLQRTLEVVDTEGEAVQVIQVESSLAYITAEVQSSSVQRRDRTEILVTFHPGLPVGELNEKLILSTDHEKLFRIEVPVEGNVIGEITTLPTQFFFGLIEKGKSLSREVVLSKTGEEALKIEKVESDVKSASVQLMSLEEGRKYAVQVKLSPEVEGTVRGVVKVHTNNAGQPVVELPLYAQVKP